MSLSYLYDTPLNQDSDILSLLPAEVLLLILQYLSTSDLLLKIRFVSRQLNVLASSMCRVRQVRLRGIRRHTKNLRYTVFDIFNPENPAGLPWSSYRCSEVQSNLEGFTLKPPSYLRFLQYYGPHILHYELIGAYTWEFIVECLGYLTNIKSIKFARPVSVPSGSVCVPVSNRVALYPGPSFSEVLNGFVTSGVRLNHLDIILSAEQCQALKQVPGLMIPNGTVSLKLLHANSLNCHALWNSSLRITSLEFSLAIFTSESLATKIEIFLANLNCLRRLNVCYQMIQATQLVPMHYPHLNTLQEFQLSVGRCENLRYSDISTIPLLLLPGIDIHNYTRYPRLYVVCVKNLIDGPALVVSTPSKLYQFNCVNTLKTEGAVSGDWNSIFPNIKLLEIEITSGHNLETVFICTGLVELKLSFVATASDLENTLVIYFCAAIDSCKAVNLTHLKYLHKLSLCGSSYFAAGNFFPPITSNSLILQVQPVILSITHITVKSQRSRNMLKKYHLDFQVHTNRPPF